MYDVHCQILVFAYEWNVQIVSLYMFLFRFEWWINEWISWIKWCFFSEVFSCWRSFLEKQHFAVYQFAGGTIRRKFIWPKLVSPTALTKSQLCRSEHFCFGKTKVQVEKRVEKKTQIFKIKNNERIDCQLSYAKEMCFEGGWLKGEKLDI